MEVSGQPNALATLPPGEKNLECTQDRKLDGNNSRSGRRGGEKEFHYFPAGNGSPVVQSIA